MKGFIGRMIHTDHMTIAYWEIKAGSPLPEHHHEHEQITHILEGSFEMTIGDEKQLVEAGMIAVIPSGVPHSGLAITDCVALDVFSPCREDYRKKMDE